MLTDEQKVLAALYGEEYILSTIFGEEYIPTGTEGKFIKADIVWGYCDHCRTTYLKCPKCGNNSCNAGYGRIWVDCDISVPCDLCVHIVEVEKFLEKEFRNPEKQDFIDLTITEDLVN